MAITSETEAALIRTKNAMNRALIDLQMDRVDQRFLGEDNAAIARVQKLIMAVTAEIAETLYSVPGLPAGPNACAVMAAPSIGSAYRDNGL